MGFIVRRGINDSFQFVHRIASSGHFAKYDFDKKIDPTLKMPKMYHLVHKYNVYILITRKKSK